MKANEACVIKHNDPHKGLLKRMLLSSSLTSNLVCPPQHILDAMPYAVKQVSKIWFGLIRNMNILVAYWNISA